MSKATKTENNEAASNDATETTEVAAESKTTNFDRVAACLALLKAIEVPATSDEVKALKAESDKLTKAREMLAGMGMDVSEIDAKIESLTAQESTADAGRAELAAELATLERTAKIIALRVGGQRVTMLREKYAEVIAAGVPEFPGPCEMQTIVTKTGVSKERAIHGGREAQIVTALLNLSDNGRERVEVETIAQALCDADPSLGDEESCTAQIRATLGSFGDVWTGSGHFVFSQS